MDDERTGSWVVGLSNPTGPSQRTGAMASLEIELAAELTEWLRSLPVRHLAVVAFYLDLLAGYGPRLGWPQVQRVDARLHKLRFHLDGRAVRVVYSAVPGHRAILLTVYMKARRRDQYELRRARSALKRWHLDGEGRGEVMPEPG